MSEVSYLHYDEVIAARRDTDPPRPRSVSGYGNKLPTDRILVLRDNRERRVYAICWSNVASHYVLVRGERRFLSPVVEGNIDSFLNAAQVSG